MVRDVIILYKLEKLLNLTPSLKDFQGGCGVLKVMPMNKKPATPLKAIEIEGVYNRINLGEIVFNFFKP
jgi:hypothetical protein